MEKLWTARFGWIKWHLPSIAFDMTLISNSHPILIHLYCHDIPPTVDYDHLYSAAWDSFVLVCPAHDALKIIDWLIDWLIYKEGTSKHPNKQYIAIYIYKEKCKTVVRELLPQASTNRNQTFPAIGRCIRPRSKGVGMHELAAAEERAAKNL